MLVLFRTSAKETEAARCSSGCFVGLVSVSGAQRQRVVVQPDLLQQASWILSHDGNYLEKARLTGVIFETLLLLKCVSTLLLCIRSGLSGA